MLVTRGYPIPIDGHSQSEQHEACHLLPGDRGKNPAAVIFPIGLENYHTLSPRNGLSKTLQEMRTFK